MTDELNQTAQNRASAPASSDEFVAIVRDSLLALDKNAPTVSDRTLVQSATASNSCVGERLRELRGSAPRRRFAESLGVNDVTLYRYERGQRPLDLPFVVSLCLACNVDQSAVKDFLAWLVFGVGRQPSVCAEQQEQP